MTAPRKRIAAMVRVQYLAAIAATVFDVCRGAGGLRIKSTIPCQRPGALVAADFNADGVIDIATISMGCDAGCDPDSNRLTLLTGLGGGAFRSAQTLTMRATWQLASGDFNGDKHPDLATYDDSLSILFSNGTNFEPPARYAIPLEPHNLITGLTMGDVDRDGALDLVLPESDGSFAVFWNSGSGLSAEPQHVPGTSEFANRMAVADLNGGGRLDLFAASSLRYNDRILIEWNVGSRNWEQVRLFIADNASPHMTTALLASDFDLDGLFDVVDLPITGNNYSDDLLGFRHVAARGFATPIDYAGPETIPGGVSIDWNADGCSDRGIPRGDSLDIQYDGGGHTVIPALPGGAILGHGDFNGDGLDDLLIGPVGPTLMISYRDPAHGYLQPTLIVAGSDLPREDALITLGDFNAEGRSDIAAAYGGYSTDSLVVYLNDGTASFARMGGGALPPAAPGDDVCRPGNPLSMGGWREVGTAWSDASGLLSFTDASVRAGAHYSYRLDYLVGGVAQHTAPIELYVPAATLTLSLSHGNPARGRVQLACTLLTADPATLDLFDIAGRRVESMPIKRVASGATGAALNTNAWLSAGVYWARLTQNSLSVGTRIVLMP